MNVQPHAGSHFRDQSIFVAVGTLSVTKTALRMNSTVSLVDSTGKAVSAPANVFQRALNSKTVEAFETLDRGIFQSKFAIESVTVRIKKPPIERIARPFKAQHEVAQPQFDRARVVGKYLWSQPHVPPMSNRLTQRLVVFTPKQVANTTLAELQWSFGEFEFSVSER